MTTVMSLKTDKKIKEQAQKIAKSMGFSLGTLLNAYMRQLVKNKIIYFTTEPSYFMSEQLEKGLEIVEKDIQKKKGISKAYKSSKEALSHLKKSA